ncbi:MAG: LysM peptidoglycan-binding domain-containing protein [bacterium]|nr:LysM peptidoglycan-binding domain-containing protein [bacterium]
MRLSHLFSVIVTVLLLPGVAVADESVDPTATSAPDTAEAVVEAPVADGDDLAWDRFDDPEFSPTADEPPASRGASSEEGTLVGADATVAGSEGPVTITTGTVRMTDSGVILGPEGVDEQGRTGRLHTVASGDTLWDLSAAYLGTPWVWPSVWIDNDDIANPHLITPGEKIWITASEMRVVSDAEAESFLEPLVEEATVATALDPAPATEPEFESDPDEMNEWAAVEGSEEDPSILEVFPLEILSQEPGAMDANRLITVASREMMGFVTAGTLAGASSIVGSPSERTFLSSEDFVFLGIGEGDTEVGDQFTIFRVVEEIRDVETNRVLGHHVENLGWVEVRELTGDTSIGNIRQAYAEIRRGARVAPREKVSRHVTLRTTPDAIEGQIVFLPSDRTLMADGGYVYLNRGEFHGVEVGSELEVFDGGGIVNERERHVDVRTPDSSIATLVVVSVESDSSVAFVLGSSRELTIGDHVRPVDSRLAVR